MANIHTSRRSGFITRGGRQVRQSVWAGFTPAGFTFTAAGGTLLFSLNATALALRPFTVVRTRLSALLISDAPGAAETYGAAMGMAVVSDQAAAIGITAIPTPITDVGSDLFFVYQLMMGSNLFTTSGAGAQGVNFEIDSKAMRKVGDDSDVVMTAEFSTLSAAGQGSTLFIGGRQLFKLH